MLAAKTAALRRRVATLGAALVALLATAGACAQVPGTYKCLDKASRVTYTNTSCDRLGLRFASVVGERLSVIAVAGVARPGGLPGAAAGTPLR